MEVRRLPASRGSKTGRKRVVKLLVSILLNDLANARTKRRQPPADFRVRVSHKHARVDITPDYPEVLDDREVRSTRERIENLLRKNL